MREHICCECIHNCSQSILTKVFLWVNVHSGVGYNSVCWKQERKICSIFSQISQILAMTGAWCMNEFCIWHLFKSTLSVKISENSHVAFSELRAMWVGSRFLQSDGCLSTQMGTLLSNYRVLLCWIWHGMIRCSVREKSGFLAKHKQAIWD